MKKKQSNAVGNLHLTLTSTDHTLLDRAMHDVTAAAKSHGAQLLGPIPLACKKELVPGADEARTLRVQRRRLTLVNANPTMLTRLSTLQLPSGVEISIKQ